MHSTSVGPAGAGASAAMLLTTGRVLEVVVEGVVVLVEGRRVELEMVALSLVCPSPGEPAPHPARNSSATEAKPTAAHRVTPDGRRK